MKPKLYKRRAIPLGVLITLPVLLQLAGLAIFTGYLIFRGGQRAIEAVAKQLLEETSYYVTQELDSYLQMAQQVNRDHVAAVKAGVLELQDLEQLHRYLILELQEHETLTSIICVLPDGNSRVVHRIEPQKIEAGLLNLKANDLPFEAGIATPEAPTEMTFHSIDQAGNLLRPLMTLNGFNIREKDWYLQAAETGELGWSEPFRIVPADLLALSTHMPVYDASGSLLAVFGVNLSLNQISAFLNQLEIREMGATFVVDSEGLLIANSLEAAAYEAILDSDGEQFLPAKKQKFKRLMAVESSHPLVSATAQYLVTEYGSLSNMPEMFQSSTVINNKQHFLQVTPYRDRSDLDWLIVTVAPEYRFMTDIYSSLRRTAVAVVIVLTGAIALCLWTARRVTRPIATLAQDAEAFESGSEIHLVRLNQPHAETQSSPPAQSAASQPQRGAIRVREVDALQQAFYQMAARIGDLLHNLEEQVQQQQYFRELAEWRDQWRDRYETATRASDRVLFEYDLAADADTWGPNTEDILGYPPEQMPSGNEAYIELIHLEDRASFLQMLSLDKTLTTPYQVEYRFRQPDGTYRWVEEQGVTRFDAAGDPIQVIGYIADISRRKRVELELEALAAVDPLTQVANRRQLEASLKREWRRHQRSQQPLTLIMLDIDHFKAFNDRFGHLEGDRCLRQVAKALQTVAHRPGDLVARYGGEEFTLLLPNTNTFGATVVAERIQRAIAQLAIANPGSDGGGLTVSMGVAVAKLTATMTPAIALAKADVALYRAKQTRNAYCLVSLE